MNRRVTGALLLLALGVVAIVGVWYGLPKLRSMAREETSDSGRMKGKIRIALDNWVGYVVLRSPELRNRMRNAGLALEVEDDRADYDARMRRLKEHEIDLAAATVDSYVLNGARYDYPGTIIGVIDESKGGDAILAREETITSLNALRGRTDVTVAYTPDSPSRHLAQAAAYHFNVPELVPSDPSRMLSTRGSEEALTKLLAGKTDVAVMWEPDVSRALAEPGIVKLLGTDDTEKLIVDVLVADRKFVRERPEAVSRFLAEYFRVLKMYRDKPSLLTARVAEETDLPDTTVQTMLKGVQWVNLTENCEKWLGIAAPGSYAQDGLVETIEATVEILKNAGDFTTNPLPNRDPFQIILSSFLETLYVRGMSGFTKPGGGGPGGVRPAGSIDAPFVPLDGEAWAALREVGRLKVEPIIFQRGAAELDIFAKQVIDRAVELLKHYPNFRVEIRGHTGTIGDAEENRRLSQDRADAVARYLEVTYDIDPDRIRAIGLGGEKPLEKEPGESRRSWQYRLPRVELVLMREDF
jgi:ABC-type nitrate/sulfonate/bicarbonate transport system substrate-binding protein